MDKKIKIKLTNHQCDLLLKYGYPFEEMKEQLVVDNGKKDKLISDDPYWWEQVLGNLSFSARKKNLSSDLIDQLDELMTLIDFEMN